MPLPAPAGPHRLIHARKTRWLPGLRWINLPPMRNPGPQSGLIVEIPEAEPAVARHRDRLDANALLGVPAHITVLFPFMPPKTIGPLALTELEHLFAEVSRFRFRLDHTDWFGDDALWLAPRDPGPFRALTHRVFQAFPALKEHALHPLQPELRIDPQGKTEGTVIVSFPDTMEPLPSAA